MSALQNLEELFVKFQRLNQILKDNWNDSTQESFDSNSLIPITTEWSNYHSSVIDMKSRTESLDREIEEDIQNLEREVIELTGPNESDLNGACVYGFNYHQNYVLVERDFLVEPGELNYLTEDRLICLAFSKYPAAEEAENIHRKEQIWIR